MDAKRVFEGVVHGDAQEKHDTHYLACDERTLIYPRYLLDGYEGQRIRITIEVVETPE